jgi:hypothetical protein
VKAGVTGKAGPLVLVSLFSFRYYIYTIISEDFLQKLLKCKLNHYHYFLEDYHSVVLDPSERPVFEAAMLIFTGH